jgi:hypothetical protein
MNNVTQSTATPVRGGRALSIFRMALRITGALQIILGLILWIAEADGIIPVHVFIGIIFVLALWAVAFMAARAGVSPAMVALTFIWGLIIPVLGIAQVSIMPNAAHWVIQVVHLLVGIIGMGLGEQLGARIRKSEPGAVRG